VKQPPEFGHPLSLSRDDALDASDIMAEGDRRKALPGAAQRRPACRRHASRDRRQSLAPAIGSKPMWT